MCVQCLFFFFLTLWSTNGNSHWRRLKKKCMDKRSSEIVALLQVKFR